MDIPDEVLEAVADRFADIDAAKPNSGRIDFRSAARRGVYREHAAAAAEVVAEWARRDMEARVVELEAVIQKVRLHAAESAAAVGEPAPHDGFEEGLDHGAAIEAEGTLRILSTAPSVVLADHNAAVWDEASEVTAEWYEVNAFAPHSHGNIDPPRNPYRNGDNR